MLALRFKADDSCSCHLSMFLYHYNQYCRFISSADNTDFFVCFYNADVESEHVDKRKYIKFTDDIAIYVNDDKIVFVLHSIFAHLSLDFSKLSLYISDGIDNTVMYNAIDRLIHIAIKYHVLKNAGVCAHSAAAIYENEAILFVGESGAGKSTQANLWKLFLDAVIINYDKPVIYSQNGEYDVTGSPWGGKERVSFNGQYPIKAIIVVKQALANCVRLMPVPIAYANIRMCFMVPLFCAEVERLYDERILDIVNHLPVYELECDMTENAVKTLYNELYSTPYENNRLRRGKKVKAKSGFVLRNIADEWILLATGENSVRFDKTLVLNDVGAYIWQQIKDENIAFQDLIDRICTEFSIDRETASRDAEAFIERLNGINVFEIAE